MRSNMASVNGSNQATASAATTAVRKSKPKFVNHSRTDSEWAARHKATYQVAADQKKAAREEGRQRALRLAPCLARRVAEARARLQATHARLAAQNPRFTISFANWLEFMTVSSPSARLVYAASCAPVYADMRRQKAVILKAEIDTRLKEGFRWRGGPVAENDCYERAAFAYHGLVSSQHPILECFVSKLPRWKNLRVADNKAETYSHRSKLVALDAPYVEANKLVCGVLRVEVDAAIPVWAIEDACAEAGVPPPNVVVGYDDEYGECQNPHLIWLLHNSIPLKGRKHAGNAALYKRVLRGLTRALLTIGADVGGLLNCHRHKNPVSPLWNRHILAQQPYHLSDLQAAVDTAVTQKDLEALAAEVRGPAPTVLTSDHPDAVVASGSNRLFRELAGWARTEVVHFKTSGSEESAFAALVADKACAIAGDITGDAAASEPSALRAAKAVSHWTWHVYRIPRLKAGPLPTVEIAVRQSSGAKLAAERKTGRTRELVTVAAKTIAVDGKALTQADTLRMLKSNGHDITERTVRRHWPEVLRSFPRGSSPHSRRRDLLARTAQRCSVQGAA